MSDLDFKITVPHNEAEDWHQWYFPGQYYPEQATENRDKAGRAEGKRQGYFPPWFILACNNTKCPGRAAVPVSLVTDHADSRDGWVSR
jgi:hypothetical protein